MTGRTSTLSWGSFTGTSWSRRVAVLVTTAATALGLAVVVGPAADAAKPVPPPPTAQLQILQVQDKDTFLPDAAPDADAVGYIRPGLPFSVTVQSQDLLGNPLPVGTKTNVTLSGSGYSATATIEKDASEVTLTGQLRSATSNFSLTAAGPKNGGYATDTIPVVVGVKSTNKTNGLGANETLTLGDCVLGADNPTCVSLSVDGAVTGNVLLSTSECATFPGTDVDCTTKKGKSTLVAQTLVDLGPGQVATAILYCDKSLCGNGGVAQYIPLVDKGNTGAFAPAPQCPAKGEIGDTEGGICVDLRQSTRFNAGDLATYILFNDDARSLH
jgi:hypothetical protein